MKKRYMIAIVVLALGGGIFGYMKWFKVADEAKAAATPTAKVERGSLRQVVNCTGKVVSNLDVDIKCKASGEVIALGATTVPATPATAPAGGGKPKRDHGEALGPLPEDAIARTSGIDGARPPATAPASMPTSRPLDVSDAVHEGQLLLTLDPIDEQRNVNKAQTSLQASRAKLETAKQNLLVAEATLVTDTARADALLKAGQTKAKDARAKADRMKQLKDKKLASDEDAETAETAAVQAATELDACNVKLEELKTQKQALELKRQDVALAQAQVDSDAIDLAIAQDRLRDTQIFSPMDGVVAALNVQKGQIIASGVSNVGGGTTVMTLSDLSHVFVVASVDEADIGRVRLGQSVKVAADAFRGRSFEGSVTRIATKGVNQSNVVTFEVKVEITSNNKGLLKPEMTTNVEILIGEANNVLTVPVEALVRKAAQQFATLVKADGAQEERQVKVGVNDGTRAEIAGGLAEGDAVLLRKGNSADSRWNGGQRPPGMPGGMGGMPRMR